MIGTQHRQSVGNSFKAWPSAGLRLKSHSATFAVLRRAPGHSEFIWHEDPHPHPNGAAALRQGDLQRQQLQSSETWGCPQAVLNIMVNVVFCHVKKGQHTLEAHRYIWFLHIVIHGAKLEQVQNPMCNQKKQ